MNISISLSDDDVRFLDEYAEEHGYASRSAVLRKAVRILRLSKLSDAYADAWKQWEASGEADVWDLSTIDGLA